MVLSVRGNGGAGRGVMVLLRSGLPAGAKAGFQDGVAFAFAKSAPNSVGFADGECVFSASVDDRACCTYRFCGVFAGCAGTSAFTFGVEEQRGVGIPA